MNYQKVVLATLMSVSVLFSCKKNDDKPEEETPVVTPAPTVYKIKSSSSTSNGKTVKTDYTYDSNGRVVKMSSDDGTSSTLDWSSANCIEKHFNSGATAPVSTTTYDLNASGLCTSQTDDVASSVTSYEYNSDGYQTKMTTTASGQTSSVTYGYTNGNQTTITTNGGGTSTTMTMEFNTDKTSTIGNINRGMTMFGKDSKNIPKKISMTISGITVSINITYEYDSKNRVSKMTQTQSGFGTTSSSSTSFTYVE